MEHKELLAKIRELTEGYTGEDEPSKRIVWLDQLLKAYQRYLPSRIIDRIKIDPGVKRVQGERRTITVAFADLSGFTSLSETMDAEDIANIINEEYICTNVADKVLSKIEETIKNFNSKKFNNDSFITHLIEGLLVSGLAISMVGSSRPP